MNNMKLFNLPNELVRVISAYLPKAGISKLCSTCTTGYEVFLPILYENVELRHRTQIKQLKEGLLRNGYLNAVVRNYTQTLTLTCRQGGNSHWLILSLFEELPYIKKLNFQDFPALSIDKVQQLLLGFPRLTHLSFRYCSLTTTTTTSKKIILSPNLLEISLLWTDFTTAAISQLFSLAPNLATVFLGANRNRIPSANDSALIALTQSCSRIKHLSTSLQQVNETTICQALKHYGQQLTRLSLRCDGDDTLKIISCYNMKLQKLHLRCNTLMTIQSCNLVHLLRKCKRLNNLEVIGWSIHSLPSTILGHIYRKRNSSSSLRSSSIPLVSKFSGETNIRFDVNSSIFLDSDQQQNVQPSNTSFLQGVQKTVALDRHDLQGIRRLCVYLCKEKQE